MRKTMTIAGGALVLVAMLWAGTAVGKRSGFGRPLRALGIGSMECSCSQTIGEDPDRVVWMFTTEPKVNKIDRDGPSRGIIKSGDSIVAIDGYLITTVEGGRRFSRIRPGEPVTLTLRRDGSTRDETIVPRRISEDTPLITGIGESDRADDLLRLSEQVEKLSKMSAERTRVLQRRALLFAPRRDKLIMTLDELKRLSELDVQRGFVDIDIPDLSHLDDLLYYDDIAPQGSFGFALSFAGSIKAGHGHDPVWRFDSPPEIQSVDPDSPADKAGLESGDVLVRIDGVDLDSDEGGGRFAAVRPGQNVEWTYRRDGKEKTVTVVANERQHHVREDAVRYQGSLGDTDVEVKGDRRVRVTEGDGVITIRTGDATIQVRRSKKD